MSRTCFLLVTAVALLLSVPASLKWSLSLYEGEIRALDQQFIRRAGAPPLATKPRVVMIGMDAETFESQAKPTLFWLGDLGHVTQALLDGGATAVGIDIIVGVVGVEGGLNEPVYDQVRSVLQDEETPLLLAILQSKKVVLAQFNVAGTDIVVPDPRRKSAPSALASAAAAEGLLCLANVQTDNDGVLRSTAFIEFADSIPGSNMFGFRLVELATGKLFKFENGKLTLGDQVVPVEMDGPVPVVRLNYPGPHSRDTGTSFEYVSFGKLLAEVKAGRPLQGFENTVCIICHSDPAEQDYRPTPYRGSVGKDALGADAHATLVNQVLTGRYIRATGTLVWVGLTLVLSWLVAAAGYRLRWLLSLPLSVFLILGYIWQTHALFSSQGLWLPVVAPVLSGAAAYLISYVGRYDVVKRLFGSMVGAQVSEHMLKVGEVKMLPGESRRVTVLFSDINDFTPMTEKSTPDRVIVMLNEYFAEMCAIVDRYQGNVKQFVGDEIMVIFNAPQSQPDHAVRAVRCAMDMIDRLAEMKAQANGKPGFYEVKIGVNTGECVAGNVGAASRMEYAVVGDDVNLGARIESLTKKLGAFLLVSAATKKECEHQLPEVEWISRGVQQFKGKSAEMEVFEVRRK